MTEEDVHEMAGIYALDALDGEEQRRFEAHLVDCTACQREVAELQEVTAHLAGLAAESPPSGLREQVLAAVDDTPQVAAPAVAPHDGVGDRARSRRSVTGVVVGAAATIVLVLGLGVSALIADLQDRIDELERAADEMTQLVAAPDAQTVTVDGPDGSLGRVVLSPSRGDGIFVAEGMDPAPLDHDYELWLIDEEGARSAGLLDLDDGGRTAHRLDGEVEQAEAVGVTVEPEGGSPEPTTDPVMLLELADA